MSSRDGATFGIGGASFSPSVRQVGRRDTYSRTPVVDTLLRRLGLSDRKREPYSGERDSRGHKTIQAISPPYSRASNQALEPPVVEESLPWPRDTRGASASAVSRRRERSLQRDQDKAGDDNNSEIARTSRQILADLTLTTRRLRSLGLQESSAYPPTAAAEGGIYRSKTSGSPFGSIFQSPEPRRHSPIRLLPAPTGSRDSKPQTEASITTAEKAPQWDAPVQGLGESRKSSHVDDIDGLHSPWGIGGDGGRSRRADSGLAERGLGLVPLHSGGDEDAMQLQEVPAAELYDEQGHDGGMATVQRDVSALAAAMHSMDDRLRRIESSLLAATAASLPLTSPEHGGLAALEGDMAADMGLQAVAPAPKSVHGRHVDRPTDRSVDGEGGPTSAAATPHDRRLKQQALGYRPQPQPDSRDSKDSNDPQDGHEVLSSEPPSPYGNGIQRAQAPRQDRSRDLRTASTAPDDLSFPGAAASTREQERISSLDSAHEQHGAPFDRKRARGIPETGSESSRPPPPDHQHKPFPPPQPLAPARRASDDLAGMQSREGMTPSRLEGQSKAASLPQGSSKPVAAAVASSCPPSVPASATEVSGAGDEGRGKVGSSTPESEYIESPMQAGWPQAAAAQGSEQPKSPEVAGSIVGGTDRESKTKVEYEAQRSAEVPDRMGALEASQGNGEVVEAAAEGGIQISPSAGNGSAASATAEDGALSRDGGPVDFPDGGASEPQSAPSGPVEGAGQGRGQTHDEDGAHGKGGGAGREADGGDSSNGSGEDDDDTSQDGKDIAEGEASNSGDAGGGKTQDEEVDEDDDADLPFPPLLPGRLRDLAGGVVAIKHGASGWPHRRKVYLDVFGALGSLDVPLMIRWADEDYQIKEQPLPDWSQLSPADAGPARCINVLDLIGATRGMESPLMQRRGTPGNADRYVGFRGKRRDLDLEMGSEEDAVEMYETFQEMCSCKDKLADIVRGIVRGEIGIDQETGEGFIIESDVEDGAGGGTGEVDAGAAGGGGGEEQQYDPQPGAGPHATIEEVDEDEDSGSALDGDDDSRSEHSQ